MVLQLGRQPCKAAVDASRCRRHAEDQTRPRLDVRFVLQERLVVKRLYVGNLSYSVGNTELEQIFAQFGVVQSAQVVQDRETGRSRGFGFVEMANDGEAQSAIEALDGKPHEGRSLTVNEARPREPRGGGAGYGGARRRM